MDEEPAIPSNLPVSSLVLVRAMRLTVRGLAEGRCYENGELRAHRRASNRYLVEGPDPDGRSYVGNAYIAALQLLASTLRPMARRGSPTAGYRRCILEADPTGPTTLRVAADDWPGGDELCDWASRPGRLAEAAALTPAS